jgi:hypothetical protein
MEEDELEKTGVRGQRAVAAFAGHWRYTETAEML